MASFGLIPTAQCREILRADFESDTLGAYTLAQCKAKFPGILFSSGLGSANRVSVVAAGDTAGSGHALRVLYPANVFGATSSGAEWVSSLSGNGDVVYLRYRLFFPDSFDWTKGGMLPGLCGSQCNSGPSAPTGSDGWSVRMEWGAGGSLGQRIYWKGQKATTGGDYMPWFTGIKSVGMETGKWHEIQFMVALNTLGQSDGRIKGWYDSVLSFEMSTMRFRDLETMHINKFMFTTYFGGNSADYSPKEENHLLIDDIIVSDSFIDNKTLALREGNSLSSSNGHLEGSALRFDPSFEGSLVQILDIRGKELAHLSIKTGMVQLPQSLPRGVSYLSVPTRGWTGRFVLP